MESINNPSSQTNNHITFHNQTLQVPDVPIIPYIEGDGSGADIWRAARRVLDAAVNKAYHGNKKISWLEVFAGQKAHDLTGSHLPAETIRVFEDCLVGIKGPLATPIGGGIRSLNVALRRALDLYVCQRPVRWFKGVPSPVLHPEYVDMVVFRENTEDLYAGIEFEDGSPEAGRFKKLLQENFPDQYARMRFPDTAGLGIKPISREGSMRLVRAAIRWSLDNHRRSVTLVHKGNIMKYTEGAFRNWGYDVAETEFAEQVYTMRQWERTSQRGGETAANAEKEAALRDGKLLIRDVITDAVFEQTITRPREFDVLATTNLNGDYISEALTAQVGGIGMAPGANINYDTGAVIFEATHGTAAAYAEQDKVNPCSFILSGEMMLRYLGWSEAADLIISGIEGAINARMVTFDLHAQMEGARLLKTSEFGDAIIHNME